MKREKMTPEEVSERLEKVPGWRAESEKLTRRFEFKNFADALDFVNKVGALAEAADHHPDVRFGWGFAEFEITTHDRGGLTEFDFSLAGQINDIR